MTTHRAVTDGTGSTWWEIGDDQWSEADTYEEAVEAARRHEINTNWTLSSIRRVWGVFEEGR